MRATRTALAATIGALLLLGGAAVEAKPSRLFRHAAKHLAAAPAFRQQGNSACGFSAQGEIYDLSSLMGTDLVGSDGGSQYQYFLSVCGAVSSDAASTCALVDSTSSVCQIQVQGGAQTFDLGNWNPSAAPQWSFINASAPALGVQYQLAGAQQCWARGYAQPYQATVQFECARELGAVKIQHDSNSCAYTAVVPTPLACPSSPPPPGPSPPAPVKGCSWNGYDLSSLAGSDLVGSDGGSQYQYYLSVCGTLSSAAARPCVQYTASASACQLQVQGGAQAFDVGNWNAVGAPQWSYISPSVPALGVQYQLSGANQCWASGAVQPYQTTVQFQCVREQSKGFKVQHNPTPCSTTFIIGTPLACPAAEQGEDSRRPTIRLTEN